MKFMRRLSALTLFCAILGSSPASLLAEDWAYDLTYKEALAKAKKEKKLVFIDFFTTWCGPCKMMDRDTFANKEVLAWLSEHAVGLKVDAERNTRLAMRFNVTAYPTLVFVRSDGKEVGRVAGYVGPAAFLDEAEGARTGKDALTRAKEKLEAAGKNNPTARLEFARVLFQNRNFAEAAEHYLWCLDQGLEHDPEFERLRLTVLMEELYQLTNYHRPLLKEIAQRRDAAEKKLRSEVKAADLAAEYHAFNMILGESEKTAELYQWMKKNHADWPARQKLVRAMLPEKLEAREYDWLDQEMDLDAQLTSMIAEHQAELEKLKARKTLEPSEREDLVANLKRYYSFRMTDFYQVAIGAKKPEKANAIAERILKFDNSADTLNILAWSGYLTQTPVPANLEQAKQAYEMTRGKDGSVVDTYVRLLYEFNKKAEAKKILDKGLKEVQDPQERQMLLNCKMNLRLTASS